MTTQIDICFNNHGGNANSISARKRTNADADRQKVLSAISRRGQTGATCDEIEVELGMAHQSCSARVSELKAKGLIATSGTRPTRTGCKASVLIATVA